MPPFFLLIRTIFAFAGFVCALTDPRDAGAGLSKAPDDPYGGAATFPASHGNDWANRPLAYASAYRRPANAGYPFPMPAGSVPCASTGSRRTLPHPLKGLTSLENPLCCRAWTRGSSSPAHTAGRLLLLSRLASLRFPLSSKNATKNACPFLLGQAFAAPPRQLRPPALPARR